MRKKKRLNLQILSESNIQSNVLKTIINHPQTIFIGAMNHSQMAKIYDSFNEKNSGHIGSTNPEPPSPSPGLPSAYESKKLPWQLTCQQRLFEERSAPHDPGG